MLSDSSIRKSLDEYIKRRIQEAPIEIKQTFLRAKQIWKCENELDFLYGYYVGKIEEEQKLEKMKNEIVAQLYLTEKHVSSTFHFMPCQYCPDCDKLLCKLNSDIKGNFRGWCSRCKLIWLLTEN